MIASIALLGILLGAEMVREDTDRWVVLGLAVVLAIQLVNAGQQIAAAKKKLAAHRG